MPTARSTPQIQLGQHPPPTRTIVHLSDTHFLAGRRPLYGTVDTDGGLGKALDAIAGSGRDIGAIVITGDLTDLGEPDAYHRLRDTVEPVARRIGADVIWVMGNHDEREPFSEILLGTMRSPSPQDRVYWVGGLRIIALDSSVPGYHHGDLTPKQLAWLKAELSISAPEGTLIALHHPPLPSPVELMAVLELQGQAEFAAVIRGSDVRAILAGHLHHAAFGSFAGIPVSVAAATCYGIDALADYGGLRGVDGGRSLSLVELRSTGITHTVVPLDAAEQVSGFPRDAVERLAAMTHDQRIAAFSAKPVAPDGAGSVDPGAPSTADS